MTTESYALSQDAADPLRRFRDEFHLPLRQDGRPAIYFCTHSLGLQPKSVRPLIEEELDAWARLGVGGHFKEKIPWYTFNDAFREAAARLVGARAGEVVMMNTLTVNLHFMMATFYRPTAERFRILVEEPTFPSDLYAVKSQLRHHGIDPAQGLVLVKPHPGECLIRHEEIEAVLEQRGKDIALILLNGVNFLTGQLLDMERIAAAGNRQGCVVGFDLAHAAGNVLLNVHDWQVDFAVWCNYKYLNGGPGAVGGCFVHQKHGDDLALPRLAGWWGNDPATRFRMQLQPDFVPLAGVAGWQVSNPSILALVPIRASLAIFDEAGMPALHTKSERLTDFLLTLLDQMPHGKYEVITPRDANQRGCQVSIACRDRPRDLLHYLQAEGVVCDFREPNVIRVAPAPLYNTFHEVWEFARTLSQFDRQP
ncbi:MAG: kynureninase [Gemmataceae bacterium]